MPYDPGLAEMMRGLLAAKPGVTERKMFGGICFFLNGNMLCGVEVGRLMFRVGKERHAEALARPGAAPMDITGRPMAGLVWVAAEGLDRERAADWIAFAENFVGALPPK